MNKEDLLKAVDKLRENIEKGEVTDLIAFTQEKKNIGEHIVADPIIGLGLAKYAEIEMKNRIQHMNSANAIADSVHHSIADFLKDLTADN